MSHPFQHLAAKSLLKRVAQLFHEDGIFIAKDSNIVFVCGGPYSDTTTMRRRFMDYAERKLPHLRMFLAENAEKDYVTHDEPEFHNIAEFEELIAEVSDCVIIFPESVGSYAELGYFANVAAVRKISLIVHPADMQSDDSFILRGPVDLYDKHSDFRKVIHVDFSKPNLKLISDRIIKRIPKNRLQEIVDLGPFEDVVNFGAADGYFSLGVLIGGLAKRSIAFEMTQKGQQAVKDNAAQNSLSEKVVIRGIADDSARPQLAELGYNTKKGLLLCDIEGAEFSVLSEKVLDDLKGTTIIIELHDRMMKEGLALREALIARLPKGAKHRILTSKPTQWIGNADIEAMSDNDRALICSEGRKVLGEWLIVTY